MSDAVTEAIAADRGAGVASLLDAKGQLPRDLVIEWPSIAKVKPYPDNPRIPGEAVADVVTSLTAFGWQQPIVVDKKFVIVAGHTRHLAAIQLRQEKVPVYVARRLTPEQAAAYRLLDNKSHERAAWDVPKLLGIFDQLQAKQFDLSLTGFRLPEIERLRLDGQPPAEFPTVSGNIETDTTCPRCGYQWSAKK
jgi:ParB-like chromosome segregation protein Spo0J